ncbi:GntR family transcriptional regulator [Vibrio ishigakensis]|nr:GntR family transcriptional regulator [Vibrio ishigakensis]
MNIPQLVKDTTKSENLTEFLIEAVVCGEIAEGSKISEPELAKRFEVSRGPLREALMRLEGVGLIERIPHVGARVISVSKQHLIELYTVRESLEGMAARLAAKHITESELERLSSLLQAHAEHLNNKDGEPYALQQGDFDFHHQIIHASRNGHLIKLLCGELYHLIRMYRYQSPRRHNHPHKALAEHQFILEAIRNRDEELSEILMRRHISGSRRLLESEIE